MFRFVRRDKVAAVIGSASPASEANQPEKRKRALQEMQPARDIRPRPTTRRQGTQTTSELQNQPQGWCRKCLRKLTIFAPRNCLLSRDTAPPHILYLPPPPHDARIPGQQGVCKQCAKRPTADRTRYKIWYAQRRPETCISPHPNLHRKCIIRFLCRLTSPVSRGEIFYPRKPCRGLCSGGATIP